MDLPSAKEWFEKITREGIEQLKYAIWEELSQIETEYETFDEPMDIEAEPEKEMKS